MSRIRGEAFRTVAATRPARNYRAAVVGCGRMGSTIDDEHIGMAHYPWPWAHAPAIIEARNVGLVAAADVDQAKLNDFQKRWGVDALYLDYHQMVAEEQPDLVAVTTGPEERCEVVIGLAEAGVKGIFATKPMCRTLAEADAMIDACRRHNTILAMACHLNWYSWYTSARKAISDGVIGELQSMICNCSSSLSNIGSHTLALLRLFAGGPAQWVWGNMNSDAQAAGTDDLSGSGWITYETGVHTILNSRCEQRGSLQWTIEIIGSSGRILSRNAHAQFELWTVDPEDGTSVQRQFPNPWHPRSSMVDAIEGVCLSIDAGEEQICPGEFGREALEIAIALRESHRRGHVRIDLPLEDRSLRLGG